MSPEQPEFQAKLKQIFVDGKLDMTALTEAARLFVEMESESYVLSAFVTFVRQAAHEAKVDLPVIQLAKQNAEPIVYHQKRLRMKIKKVRQNMADGRLQKSNYQTYSKHSGKFYK